jgi:hypothetical protein
MQQAHAEHCQQMKQQALLACLPADWTSHTLLVWLTAAAQCFPLQACHRQGCVVMDVGGCVQHTLVSSPMQGRHFHPHAHTRIRTSPELPLNHLKS